MTHEHAAPKNWRDGLTGYHYLVLAVAIMGWMFDTMDQWLFVYAKQHAIRELMGPGATDADVKSQIGYATTLLMLGWATGGLFFGMVGDRLGRTRTMAITILMYAGFTGLSGLAQTVNQFAALRFLTGLGIGGEFAAGAALVAESLPEHSRATALSLVQAISALGNVLAGVVNMGMAATVALETAWRWQFALGVLPAVVVVVLFFYIQEPEAWKEARRHAKEKGQSMGSIGQLLSHPTWRRHTLVGVTLAAVGVIGFWGIGTWSAELLRKVLNPDNLTEPQFLKTLEYKVSFAVMLQNFGSFFGALAFAWMARRIGRRWAFAVAFLMCLVVVPCTFGFTHSFVHALIFLPMMGFALLTIFGGYAVYFPELYPTRLRSTGIGFCYNVARFVSAFAPYLFGQISGKYGIRMAGIMISAVFIIGLIVLPFGPETKDKPLPE